MDQLTGALKQGTIQIAGSLGGLQLRGNQLTRVAMASAVVDQLRQALTNNGGVLTNVLGRCALTDNTFEDIGSFVVAQQVSLMSNKFTLSARTVVPGAATVVSVIQLGTSIADNAVFVGNQSRGQKPAWRNLSRMSDQAANVNVTVS